MLTSKTSDHKRWPRGQKFTLAAAGAEAIEAHRNAVASARAGGRSALETALAQWAGPRRLDPGDGVILSELCARPLGLSQLCEALEPAGIARDQVRDAIGRLVDAGIVEPVPLASQTFSAR